MDPPSHVPLKKSKTLMQEMEAVSRLKKKTSVVNLLDNSGNAYSGYKIWSDIAPAVKNDPTLMFALCTVSSIKSEHVLLCTQIDPPGDNSTFEVPLSNAWNTNSQIDPMTYGDIGMLPHTNVPCILDFLRHRYMNNQIYTTAEPLVLAINPFKNLGNTTDEWVERYRSVQDLRQLDPHIFYTSRRALDNLYEYKQSQTIIVSGESGAGKTEAIKQMMRFFAVGSKGDHSIQDAIMAANPVLEAFGNAKTIRNNNSSRFGRFMKLQVSRDGGIRCGSVLSFLLEKSRILTQDENERSYHIFYQLIKGAPAEMKKKLHVLGLQDYKFINPKCTDADGIDDVEDFKLVFKSFQDMKLSAQQIETIFSIVSGVLLMGNVEFIKADLPGFDDAAEISPASRPDFEKACELMFLNKTNVEQALLEKITFAGGSEIRGRWKCDEAKVLAASLSKAMYEKLFEWIINNLNKIIEPEDGFDKFIGMLDIFGFEVFKNNSLEQLFINLTNEMLQSNFVNIVFKREAELYASEGIPAPTIEYTTNFKVVELLCKGKCILSVLEDQCLAPSGSDEKFVSNCQTNFKDNEKFEFVKVGSNINFAIVHSVGSISYNATNFLLKNKDVLRSEMTECVQESDNEIVKNLFAGVKKAERGKIAKGSLIGSQFLLQLQSLMDLINSTDPHFVRCIKPNEAKKPLQWISTKVLIQLHALSVIEILGLRQLGYSYRRPFKDAIDQYSFLVGQEGSDDVTRLLNMLKENVGADGYAIGKTMVFMTSQVNKDLTKLQRAKLAAWNPLMKLVESSCEKAALKRRLDGHLPNLAKFQAYLRRAIHV